MEPSTKRKLRVLEFFSGIGGWHAGLRQAVQCTDSATADGAGAADFTVVGSFDVNPNANLTYHANHPSVPQVTADLKKLSVKKLDAYRADVWVMSPPCQPHTRNGKKGDEADPRSAGFHNLLRILAATEHPPAFFLLENVEGFEDSQSRHALVRAIAAARAHYHSEEFILSPTQFGVPNQRDRYYFLARQVAAPSSAPTSAPTPTGAGSGTAGAPAARGVISGGGAATSGPAAAAAAAARAPPPQRFLPRSGCARVPARAASCSPGSAESHAYWEEANRHCRPVGAFLADADPGAGVCGAGAGKGPQPNVEQPTKRKRDAAQDAAAAAAAVSPPSKKSGDIGASDAAVPSGAAANEGPGGGGTAGKGEQEAVTAARLPADTAHLPRSAYLVPDKVLVRCGRALDIVDPTSKQTCCFTKAYTKYGIGTGSVLVDKAAAQPLVYPIPRDVAHLRTLQLRYFSPREVANLLGFPPEFMFPAALSQRQMYALLGNSLSVTVVAKLLTHLLRGAGVLPATADATVTGGRSSK